MGHEVAGVVAQAASNHRHAGTAGDWASIEQAENERLVTALAMLCPLEPSEKQLLLEAGGLALRAEALTAVLEAAVRDEDAPVVRH